MLGKLVFTARHLEILLYSSQLWRMVLKIQRKKHIWVWLEKQRGKMCYMLNRNGKCSLQNNMDTLFTKRILLLKRNCIGFHVSPFKKTPRLHNHLHVINKDTDPRCVSGGTRCSSYSRMYSCFYLSHSSYTSCSKAEFWYCKCSCSSCNWYSFECEFILDATFLSTGIAVLRRMIGFELCDEWRGYQ